MRRLHNQLRILLDLACDRDECIDEEVEFLFAFSFRGLDHQRTGHNERKTDSVRMKPVIDQPLRDVACPHALLRLTRIAEDAFVHRRRLVGKVVIRFQVLANVVRVENGIDGRSAQPRTAMRHDVCQGPH